MKILKRLPVYLICLVFGLLLLSGCQKNTPQTASTIDEAHTLCESRAPKETAYIFKGIDTSNYADIEATKQGITESLVIYCKDLHALSLQMDEGSDSGTPAFYLQQYVKQLQVKAVNRMPKLRYTGTDNYLKKVQDSTIVLRLSQVLNGKAGI